MSRSWYVYIVECADGTLYTGATTDVKKRLDKHNRGRGAKYTRGRTPVVLRAVSRALNRSESHKLEHLIKQLHVSKKVSYLTGLDEAWK